MAKSVWWAQAFFTGRAYGGPEEGGWWYDTGEHIMSLPFLAEQTSVVTEDGYTEDRHDEEAREKARLLLLELCEVAGNNTKSKKFKIFFATEPGEDYPLERPYFE